VRDDHGQVSALSRSAWLAAAQAGLRRAAELALAHPRVCGLQIGYADLFEPAGIARDEEAAGEVGYYFFTLQGAASFALDASPALYAPPPPLSPSST
jgi:citrate lyase beta subunit